MPRTLGGTRGKVWRNRVGFRGGKRPVAFSRWGRLLPSAPPTSLCETRCGGLSWSLSPEGGIKGSSCFDMFPRRLISF